MAADESCSNPPVAGQAPAEAAGRGTETATGQGAARGPSPGRRATRLLWRAVQPEVRQVWFGFFWLAVAAGLDALGPVLGKAFIDRYLVPRDPQLGAILGLLGGALVAGCCASLLRYGQLKRLAGVASTWPRKRVPRPAPSDAPSIRPGMSASTKSTLPARTTPRFGCSVVKG